MISNELLDEIIFVSLKNEIISKELIEKIVFSIIEDCDELTQNYFSDITFEDEEWNFAIASCDKDGKINISYDKIKST